MLEPPNGRMLALMILSRLLEAGKALRHRVRTGSQFPCSSTVSRTHPPAGLPAHEGLHLAYGCGPAPESHRTSPASGRTAEAVVPRVSEAATAVLDRGRHTSLGSALRQPGKDLCDRADRTSRSVRDHLVRTLIRPNLEHLEGSQGSLRARFEPLRDTVANAAFPSVSIQDTAHWTGDS